MSGTLYRMEVMTLEDRQRVVGLAVSYKSQVWALVERRCLALSVLYPEVQPGQEHLLLEQQKVSRGRESGRRQPLVQVYRTPLCSGVQSAEPVLVRSTSADPSVTPPGPYPHTYFVQEVCQLVRNLRLSVFDPLGTDAVVFKTPEKYCGVSGIDLRGVNCTRCLVNGLRTTTTP